MFKLLSLCSLLWVATFVDSEPVSVNCFNMIKKMVKVEKLEVPAKIYPEQTKPLQVFARPVGYHYHQCPICYNVWGHGSESFGNVAAHTCPTCHRGQSWRHYMGPVPLRMK